MLELVPELVPAKVVDFASLAADASTLVAEEDTVAASALVPPVAHKD